MKEQRLKEDFHLNLCDNEVLRKAQNLGIRHVLEAKEVVIPIRYEKEFYIFLSFKKKGDEGYSYVRVTNPEKNFPEAMQIVMEYAIKMNCRDIETHVPVSNIN
jgi:hypothetical protein